MKNVYFFLLAFLGFTFAAEAQVIVYHENFNNTVTGVTGNFQTVNAPAHTDTLYTGGAYKWADATANEMVISNSISTYNLRNITITWNDFRTQYWRKVNGKQDLSTNSGNNYAKIDNTKPVVLEYSTDGGKSYIKAGQYAASGTFFTWGAVNGGVAIQLPEAVSNQADVRFRWSVSVNNTNTDYYAIDDILILGTPVLATSTFNWSSRPLNEDPFTASSAATNPYQADGVSLNWTKAAVGTGVTLEAAKITTDFHKKNNLTLIQSGAGAATGTEVTLQLSKAVSGLTFNILDVDRTAGQYKDKVQVIAYNGRVPVQITKNSILPRLANEYSSGLILAKADGVDSKVTSSTGNVTISFVGNVDKVVITYYNDDAAKGRQGIAIADMSWGMVDAAISTLPVELAHFKGQSQNGNARLYWTTASEKNNEKFVVERSQDGKTFSQVGEVQGHGTSSSAISYSFTDTNPVAGANYYRLRQIDFDGAEAFSHIVALEFAQQPGLALATVYPTVAASDITISLNAKANATIVVVDAAGRTVAQFANVASRELVVPVQHLNQGIYFVTVTDGQQRETQRFVKR